MEMNLDWRCFDETQFWVAVLGVGGVEDVGPRLMPIGATSRLHLRRILLLSPNVRPGLAGFLKGE